MSALGQDRPSRPLATTSANTPKATALVTSREVAMCQSATFGAAIRDDWDISERPGGYCRARAKCGSFPSNARSGPRSIASR